MRRPTPGRVSTALVLALLVTLAGCGGAALTGTAGGANGTGNAAGATGTATITETPAEGTDEGTDAGGTAVNATTTGEITATGTASVSASPDRAVVSVVVESVAGNATTARSETARGVERLRTALADAGYEVRTAGYDLSPEYDHTGEGRELVGYRATHELVVETVPEAAGEVVDLAVDNGATAVRGVHFTLSAERRAELRSEALSAAVTDARATARTVAAAEGRAVGEAISMRVDAEGLGGYEVRLTADAGGGAASTSFDPGPVTVRASVTVTYELEG